MAPHRADWARWAAGRGRHRLFMALVRDAAAVQAIERAQGGLAGLRGVELHARHFFHISLQTCGFGGEVPIDEGRVAEALGKIEPFEVALGGLNAFHSAVFLETHSGGRLLEVRRALRRALGTDVTRVDPHDGFLFHLTVGYLSGEADVREVRARVASLRECYTATVKLDEVALLELPTDQRVPFPELRPLRMFGLADR